jgi:hypothetical protein
MPSQNSKNPSQTLLNLINHAITEHPELAQNVEQIVRAIQGKEYGGWEARDYAVPSPHFIKQAVLLRNAFPNAKWIETGTYLGETTKKLSEHGAYVYSIEPEPTLYANAATYFKSYPNVEILKGLSEEIFPSLLPSLSGDINFWLDGHYSAGITHKGPQDTPILDELAHISSNLHHFGRVCVMIDDIRCFNPELDEYSAYPSLNMLVDWANQNRLNWHIEHDILVAKSKPTPPQP